MSRTECYQGSNSGSAITHDSDPKLLTFQAIDAITGQVVSLLGDTPDLSNAANPAIIAAVPGVPGPTIGQLTGGDNGLTGNLLDRNGCVVGVAGNPTVDGLTNGAVGFTFNYAGDISTPVIDNLTAGQRQLDLIFNGIEPLTPNKLTAGNMTLILTTDDPSITLEVTAAQIKSLADAQGLGNSISGTLDLTAIVDLSGLVGHNISNAYYRSGPDVQDSRPFTATVDINKEASTMDFRIMAANTELINGTLADVQSLHNSISVPVNTGDKIFLTYSFVSAAVPGNYITSFTLSSAQLIALATAQSQLGNSNGLLDISSIFDMAGYIGSSLTRVQLSHPDLFPAWVSSVPIDKVSSSLDYELQSSNVPFTSTGIINTNLTDDGSWDQSFSPAIPILTGYKLLVNFGLTGTATSASWGPLLVHVDQFKIRADEMGEGGTAETGMYSTWNGVQGFPWDLSGLVGKTITSIDANVTNAFTGRGLGDTSTISLQLRGNANPLCMQQIFGTGISHHSPIQPQAVTASGDGSDILIHLTLEPLSTLLTFTCSASDILAAATDAQKAAQSAFVDMGADLLAPYIGYTMSINSAFDHMVYAYGPASMNDSSTLLIQVPYVAGHGTWEDLKSAPPTVVSQNSIGGVIIDSDTRIQVGLSLTPLSTPDVPAHYLPLLMTEPYETRSRNNPAFRVIWSGPHNGSTLNLNCQMFGSQGPVRDDGTAWEWTPIPVNILKSGNAYIDNIIATLNILELPTIPPNPTYSGDMLTVSNNFRAPWNYVKLWFYCDLGEAGARRENDYAGLTVQVIANAREL